MASDTNGTTRPWWVWTSNFTRGTTKGINEVSQGNINTCNLAAVKFLATLLENVSSSDARETSVPIPSSSPSSRGSKGLLIQVCRLIKPLAPSSLPLQLPPLPLERYNKFLQGLQSFPPLADFAKRCPSSLIRRLHRFSLAEPNKQPV